jgi:tRNA A-37 threonylcarbamoyl transferase component Bud32
MSGAIGAPGDQTLTVAPEQTPVRPEPTEFPRDFGGYRLLGLLGTGGMGTVYEAEQSATGRRVALKMLEQQLDSSEMRQRFLREGRLAASVNHPNSLYVFGSEEVESIPVITMEIAGGGTLKDKLSKRGPLPVKEAVDAILDVISGLEAAFAAGVLHRDIKPSNCFVSPDGSVKVGDFGLSVSTMARDDSYATATGVVMGTPAFAPPEQLRGDELDVRADIYSVGATLFTLITGQAPFEGKNAVQVVANAVNQKPKPLSALRDGVPPGLERVVARCLAKEPGGRYGGYEALRDALLPFSSREPEPASMKVRAAAGWIDYLIAFLIPYVILMLFVGNEEFHLRLFMDRTLYSARYHVAFLCFGFLYFMVAEGIFGAGLGKRLKGLCVVRTNGRLPGIGRALLRILIPILSIEGIRIPLVMALMQATEVNHMTGAEVAVYSAATTLCPMIPALLACIARRDNAFTTIWDMVSGTRVVFKQKGIARPTIEPAAQPKIDADGLTPFGPYKVGKELVPGKWIAATDPLLRRRIWLLRREAEGPSDARRAVTRAGRLRWLQKVEQAGNSWDAFEATRGASLSGLIQDGKHLPWETLRHWLHDLASELWLAEGDRTLPAELSLDNVWITAQGHAVLLDEPWPDVERPAERIPVSDIAGQQRFLHSVSSCVESTTLPLHARPVLQNLEAGKFEKMSFLTGTLRGLLDKPAEVSKGIRAGSIFMLPFYAWIMLFVGSYQGAEWLYEIIGGSVVWLVVVTAMLVLSISALAQLLAVPFRTSFGNSLFRLALVDAEGAPAAIPQLISRWAIVWLPLLAPMSAVALLARNGSRIAIISALSVLLLWILAACYALLQPNRGLHDRFAGTWVVRR